MMYRHKQTGALCDMAYRVCHVVHSPLGLACQVEYWLRDMLCDSAVAVLRHLKCNKAHFVWP